MSIVMDPILHLAEKKFTEAVDVKNPEALHEYFLTIDDFYEKRQVSEKYYNNLETENNQILKAIKTGFEKSDIRFEEMNKRFEQVDKRFEQVDKRFEQVDKRFEDMQRQMDKRFEQVDKRFEDMQRQMDKRFDQADKRFSQMQWTIGVGFVLITVLMSLYNFFG